MRREGLVIDARREQHADLLRAETIGQEAGPDVLPTLNAGHEPELEATHAADVVELTAGPSVAQCPRDGQRGVDVPAGPAARYRIPHRAMILSERSRG